MPKEQFKIEGSPLRDEEKKKEDEEKDRLERIKMAEIAVKESPTYENLPPSIKEKLDFKEIAKSWQGCGDVVKLELDEKKRIKDLQWHCTQLGAPVEADVEAVSRKYRLKNFFGDKDCLTQSLFREDSTSCISSDLKTEKVKEEMARPHEIPNMIEVYDYIYDKQGELKKIKDRAFFPPYADDPVEPKWSRALRQKQYSKLLKRFEE